MQKMIISIGSHDTITPPTVACFVAIFHIYYIKASILKIIPKQNRCSSKYVNPLFDRPFHDLSFHMIVSRYFRVNNPISLHV